MQKQGNVYMVPGRQQDVAELVGERGLVGMVRGCMKCVGTGLGIGHMKIGCILGLRVSPRHRRMGIGLKLVKSLEGWAIRNGAQYMFLATEENNIASINLFVLKCNYTRLSSLAIFVQPIDVNTKKNLSPDVSIEKLSIEQAISLYKYRLESNKLFPLDIEAILQEQLSLGTWVSYFKEEHWGGLHCKETDNNEFISSAPSSWAIISLWKTCECYKLQIKGTPLARCLHSTLIHIGSKVLPCLRVFSSCDLLSNTPFGFLFLYGIHGEGERVGDLMRSLWIFACNMSRTIKDCKAIVTELGVCDPLRNHIPWESSTLRIDDLWFLKRVTGDGLNDDNYLANAQPMPHVFIDPRDF